MKTPAYWMNGIPESTPIAMHAPMGVCSRECTLLRIGEAGSRSSRDIPKQSLIVDVSIARQQTKIAAETTSKKTVEKPLPKFASMMFVGPQAPLIASPRFGIASKHAYRNTAPITNAPMTDPSTARGASRRGSFVSSASVDAVSKP